MSKETGSAPSGAARLEARAGSDPDRFRCESSRTLDVRIGAKVMLELAAPKVRVWTEFVGMRRDRFLIVTLPGRADVRGCLCPEQALTVRYLHEGYHVCGFQSSVESVSVKPYSLLFLSWPPTVSVVNLRREDRVNCFLPSSVFIQGREYPGYMTDISESGARLVLAQDETGAPPEFPDIAMDEEVFCLFRMIGLDTELYIRAGVKNLGADASSPDFGVQFLELDDKARNSIQSYIELVKKFFFS